MPSSFDLALIGDTHFGSSLIHEEGVDLAVEWLRRKTHFGFHMGDWIEAILVDDPRFQADSTCIIGADKQRDYAIKKFYSVRSHLLGGLLGNHELKLLRYGNPVKDICKALKIAYGTYVSVVRLYDKHGYLFSLYLGHGWRSISSNAKDFEQRQANMKAALKMQLKYKAGDCLVMGIGHTHKLLRVHPAPQLYLMHEGERNKGKLQSYYLNEDRVEGRGFIDVDKRWYVNTGSFQKLASDILDDDGEPISGYAEWKGYDPIELGYPILQVRDRELQNIDLVKVG